MITAQLNTHHSQKSRRRSQQFQDQEPQVQRQTQNRGRVGIGDDYYDEQGDAQDRDRYYASVQDSFDDGDPQALYRKLNQLISRGTRQLSYKEARDQLYSKIDRRPDGGLYYLYSGEGPKNESEFQQPAKHKLSNYNCEHVVPQSWFHKRSEMKSDLHHLFTEQVQCNGSRGNYPLDEVPPQVGDHIPNCGVVDDGEAFEPKAGKGEVARATLYFLTRYPGMIGDSNNEYQEADLAQLLEWHREYPVSDYERHRNDTIEEEQGNRNPYIDFPKLADAVDFKLGFG